MELQEDFIIIMKYYKSGSLKDYKNIDTYRRRA